MLAHPTGITVIAQSLKTTNLKTKILSQLSASQCTVLNHHEVFLIYSSGDPWGIVSGAWGPQEGPHCSCAFPAVCL